MGPPGAIGAPGTRGAPGDFGPEVRHEIMCTMYFMYIINLLFLVELGFEHFSHLTQFTAAWLKLHAIGLSCFLAGLCIQSSSQMKQKIYNLKKCFFLSLFAKS